MAHVLFLLVCVIWGSSFILMKYADVAFGAMSIGAWRVTGGAVFLALVWVVTRRGRRWPMTRRDVAGLSVIVLLGYCVPFVMQPYLIGKYGDSAFFGMMVALVPLMTMVVSAPLLRVRPTLRQMCGVAIGLLSLGVLMGIGIERNITGWDLLLAALVPVSYATSNTYVKRRFEKYPPLAVTLSSFIGASMLLLPVSFATESTQVDVDGFVMAVACLAILGVIGSGLATFLFFTIIQQRGPLFAGMVAYIVPVGAVCWGWLDGETVTRWQLVALVGVFAGVALVQTARPMPAPPASQPQPWSGA